MHYLTDVTATQPADKNPIALIAMVVVILLCLVVLYFWCKKKDTHARADNGSISQDSKVKTNLSQRGMCVIMYPVVR